MEVRIDRSFQTDVRKLRDKALLKRIAVIIAGIQQAQNPGQITNLQKLKGSSSHYRISV